MFKTRPHLPLLSRVLARPRLVACALDDRCTDRAIQTEDPGQLWSSPRCLGTRRLYPDTSWNKMCFFSPLPVKYLLPICLY